MQKTFIIIKPTRRFPIVIQFIVAIFVPLFVFIIYKFLISENSVFRQLFIDYEYWVFILPILIILFEVYFVKELLCVFLEMHYYCKLSSLKIVMKNFRLYSISAHIDIQSRKTLNDLSNEFFLGYDLFIDGEGQGGGGSRFLQLKKIKPLLKDHSYSFNFSQDLKPDINYNNFLIKLKSKRFGFTFVHYFKIFQAPRIYLGFWEFPSYKCQNYLMFKEPTIIDGTRENPFTG
jgi:hypothetical protein